MGEGSTQNDTRGGFMPVESAEEGLFTNGASKPRPDLTPRPIVALEESVVNRIAAGEIIIRPANAIKELLENCIDAGATSVKINVKDGGAKMLQIQDNGSGIRKVDLAILCERFTTSKIRKFDDLSSLRTYGFRGEALASISHIAHLTIATKTRSEGVGWKAQYSDGKLVPLKAGGSPAPQPCAGNDGTVITVEDMFYNVPQRRKALQSASDEYRKILDVVTRYAIHNQGVAISCKKAGSASPDVNTTASATILETIGRLFSETLKKELMHLEFTDKKLGFKVVGYFSTANYNAKKATTMIFINNRLVDCSPLRKSLEITYLSILPKGSFPFIYISLEIAPDRVDPNVHPNKKEVHFLDQDEIVERICDKLNVFLAGSNSSRSYHVQTLLPMATADPNNSQADPSQPKTCKSTKTLPQKMVRTDHRSRTLHSMLRRATGASGDDLTPGDSNPNEDQLGSQTPALTSNSSSQAPQPTSHTVKIEESVCLLKSVQDLRQEIKSKSDNDLENLIRHHTFVGVVDTQKGYSCIQHETRLYLIYHFSLCEELFYQLGVRQFGSFDRIQLKPTVPVKTLVTLAVESEPSEYLDKIGRTRAVQKICEMLYSKAEMLDEYFSFQIDCASGNLVTLPVILPEHVPNMEKLPLFLVRAAVECDWTDELSCFSSFLRELAFFYTPSGLPLGSMSEAQIESIDEDEKEQLKQVLFPAMKRYLAPPSDLRDDLKQVTSLPELYKVFERC
ncbi:hypothetical protein PTTG_03631 [Puccinia triticina 1-1 BBBD Race 1]|uniref:DNA_mis_repair domain-containing protein n=2 Tax=Puccinia triticina TaxID=208348 RepID=A0A180GSE2_PUCT1|nr:uncharacterized protein PtA15_3A511 [Puccinia triticina]OAV95319.1 hypothetical protein PTTG_03631 [Puccinia triticina 1-1 BBBD Race 1]WAQ83144.1 hypothetical protein PtA15_3A511 [Puccinia triticina]WAR53984.1 hypothetical protein PtB15_3B494 [Puccinia triticina]